MKSFVAVAMAALLLVVSCAREGFSVSSARLEETDGALVFRFAPTDTELDYDFIVSSPSGELTWSGKAERGEAGYFVSPPLEITEGASFEKGEYSFILYGSNGTELSDTVLY